MRTLKNSSLKPAILINVQLDCRSIFCPWRNGDSLRMSSFSKSLGASTMRQARLLKKSALLIRFKDSFGEERVRPLVSSVDVSQG